MFNTNDNTSFSWGEGGDHLRSLREALKSAQGGKSTAALSPAALIWTVMMMRDASRA